MHANNLGMFLSQALHFRYVLFQKERQDFSAFGAWFSVAVVLFLLF